MPVSQETLDEIALTREEYDLIVSMIEREPNGVELGLFGALWSEHCGYKHSKPLLRGFPTTGEAVRVQAGEENAGVVDIGGGLAVVFKIESHNHPSAVEPYQGAATGVGGIVRDILAMGARPIALLNSLRFGPLDTARNRYLFQGVVAGISGYGNCIGVPDVGGETMFAPTYSGNPLVNAMCVGLLPHGALMRAAAANPGSLFLLAGSATGRDGIHGASGLASRTFEEEREMRPTVQVGDPFLEKVLIEACLEAAGSGLLDGMQDLGAAGLTSSVMECAARGGTGVEIDVALVPRREDGMTPYEVMLSESQERMLLIVKPENEDAVRRIFDRWDVLLTAIGTVTSDGVARVYDGPQLAAEVNVATLVEAPQYRPGGTRPAYLDALHAAAMPPPPDPREAGRILRDLLASPNVASKRAVYRRYDHEVQTRTMVKPGAGDAAVLRLREIPKALALAVDGNGRTAWLDPYTGGAMAVAEACRNVAASGATPLAVTDCLNFGNPQKPEVYYQLEECIRGMADACRALGVPVVSGNVSLYNETQGEAVYPTPVVGAVGLLDDARNALGAAFASEGDAVLAGSEYLALEHGTVAGKPSIDLDTEARLQRLLVGLARGRLLSSAHDCADGGLAVALAESAVLGVVGFTGAGGWPEGRWDAALFGETASCAVVSCSGSNVARVEAAAQEAGVPCSRLGATGGARFAIPGLLDEPLADLADAFFGGLERALNA
ncbi:MAG: phosphoribosylformylglycinamidine synthase subunit PurL [Chloroflexi bacterium]|nr:phosphoribosylformylglycinamidine synthase subunit PurL [Chloroflexota bacterium]